MRVTSLAKNFLVLFRYPRLPQLLATQQQLDGDTNVLPVGALRVRIPGSTACQVFYPASPDLPTNEKMTGIAAGTCYNGCGDEFHPYFRPQAVEGLAEYTGTDIELLKSLCLKEHPCRIGAEPVFKKNSKEPLQMPLVVFSHGLGGCMEMYTQLCAEIASHGFLVVALEHEDGSGCFAETEDGNLIYYKRSDNTPYSREKVLKFRGPMLKKRIGEVERVLDYIMNNRRRSENYNAESGSGSGEDYEDKDEERNIELLKTLFSAVKKDVGVSLIGHSFGAATMTLVEQHLASSSESHLKVNSVALLDPWCFALSDKRLFKGIEAPVFSALSGDWMNNSEGKYVIRLLESSNVAESLCAPGAVHQSFSDTGSWLPKIIAKKMWMMGKQERRHETCRAVAQAYASHVKNYIGDHDVVANTISTKPAILEPFAEYLLKQPLTEDTSELTLAD